MTKIAVSSGDPAGIGPDICIKAFGQKKSLAYKPVIFGNIDLLKERADEIKIQVDIKEYRGEDSNSLTDESLWVVDRPISSEVKSGSPEPGTAKYIMSIFEESVKKTISKEFNAVVTCPINKELMNKGGISFTGHTEELASLGNTKDVVMMLANEKIKIALATTHLPLSEVPSHINEDLLVNTISIINQSLKNHWKLENPIIKVLGLNPHAGDGGYLGREEKDIIGPTLNKLREQGLEIIGPVSADTAFVELDKTQKADAILAMYHDQGLPVIKTMGFGETVNITLGLPFIRTSVDHGTAYDKTGTGQADESSLLAATEMACSMSKRSENAKS